MDKIRYLEVLLESLLTWKDYINHSLNGLIAIVHEFDFLRYFYPTNVQEHINLYLYIVVYNMNYKTEEIGTLKLVII